MKAMAQAGLRIPVFRRPTPVFSLQMPAPSMTGEILSLTRAQVRVMQALDWAMLLPRWMPPFHPPTRPNPWMLRWMAGI
jgi:hypothetical protein